MLCLVYFHQSGLGKVISATNVQWETPFRYWLNSSLLIDAPALLTLCQWVNLLAKWHVVLIYWLPFTIHVTCTCSVFKLNFSRTFCCYIYVTFCGFACSGKKTYHILSLLIFLSTAVGIFVFCTEIHARHCRRQIDVDHENRWQSW